MYVMKSISKRNISEAESIAENFKLKIDKCTRIKDLSELKNHIGLTMSDFVYDSSGGICEEMDEIWRDLSNAIEERRKYIQNN